ncbi:hypothetical protein HYALB_00003637 [Hymenoscyphus albidus]|uniref:Uncharacterized protein n=1 Tax=Hymenoscyphus albidus TaxID=595503 RepID=A0A9N9QCB6_9HELO|nr:hypothetical protein HYALB_00003637 [Hymenoscyphus albidus]
MKPCLVFPESGVELRTSSTPTSAVPAVLGLSLSDSVLEEMIKCVQNGKPIQLSLGEHPNVTYGTKTQHLSTTNDPFTHELFCSTNIDSEYNSLSTETMAFSDRNGKSVTFGTPAFKAPFRKKHFVPGPKPAARNLAASKAATSTIEGADNALAQLQNSLASEKERKLENTTKLIKNGPAPSRKGAASKITGKTKMLQVSQANRSMPVSPALSGVGSPALGPTSVPLSEQKANQEKQSRKPIIHLLASADMTERQIRDLLPNADESDFKYQLTKVADKVGEKYVLAKRYYRELDVWSYDYPHQDDRQRAIDNAVKRYDNLRIGVSEPEWDRLLPKAERGTGKSLSKLQGLIAQGLAKLGPKVDDGSGRDTSPGEDEELGAKKKKDTKPKKLTETQAQAKRLLSNKPNKAASKASPRPTPAAKKEKTAAKASNVKPLSAEFVGDSDDDDVEVVPRKPITKPASAMAKKRQRDEEIETSDSSIPLSKKVKKDAPATNHRVSDASQTSRTTATSFQSSNTVKTKDTSPQKSSPLASSPPTNASEFDRNSGHRTTSSSSTSPASHAVPKTSRSPIQKRHHKSPSVSSSTSSNGSTRTLRPEVLELAKKYRVFYPSYTKLHKELSNLKYRDRQKEDDLLQMHARLADMKKRIMEGVQEN